LNAAEAVAVKDIMNDVIRMLAEGKVDTNVYSSGSNGKGKAKESRWIKENEQNRMNREREIRFSRDIER
jgi:kinetochore protein Mis13/DSN1